MSIVVVTIPLDVFVIASYDIRLTYLTLKGHFLRGEERVTVALRDGSQQVEIEIFSISRAGKSLSGKTLWPLIGKMQNIFFRQQLEHLAKSGSEDICDRRTTTIEN